MEKSKARERSQFLTGHRNFTRSNKPKRKEQFQEVVEPPQEELDKQKYLGIKLDQLVTKTWDHLTFY